MPIYSYRCDDCKTEFEAFASIKKKETGWQPLCPKCGSQNTRQNYKTIATMLSSKQMPPGGGCCSNRLQ